MNDSTPRRYEGTLLERAAARFDLAPRPPVLDARPSPAIPAFAPPPAFDLAMPRVAAPAAWSGARRSTAIDREHLIAQGMLVPGARVNALAEEFRQVKRQLLLGSRAIADADPAKARTMLVCSAKPGEGKTFCAVNLALSLAAERDVEVLLVDADFPKPDVLARLGASVEGQGLLDAIADPGLPVESLVVDTDVPQLKLLPAGARSDSDTELLSSAYAGVVIAALASANPKRIVVFDSPPALAASPAAVLSGYVGQIMLVVRADKTCEADLRDAVGLLDACEHIQLVLNSVAYQPGGRRFSYYGQEPEK